MVFEWAQTFAPGKTEVDITYNPLFGAGNGYDAYYPGGSAAPRYCLNDIVKRKFAALKTKDIFPEPFTVEYILKTAGNWNGSIGEFHLKVANKNSFASFCVPDGLKPAGDGNSWTARNLRPKSDLKVVFFKLPQQ